VTTSELGNAAGGASAVKQVFTAVTQLLMKQGRVEIDGFGTFELHKRKARRARNPRTGERINVPAKLTVKFKPAGALKREAEQRPDVPDGA
jgi:nucleoid DNA-binding protein